MLSQKGGYNWYYTSYTFEADKDFHTHDETCFKDVESSYVETDFEGHSETKTSTYHKNLCGFDGLRWLKFVTFADSPAEAEHFAITYAATKRPEGFRDYTGRGGPINLYQKNYIRDSRALVASGNYAGIKPEGV